jgi:hypothetical protein
MIDYTFTVISVINFITGFQEVKRNLLMKIDTSLGYDHWVDVLASVHDNPLDSISDETELLEAISEAFDEDKNAVLGSIYQHMLFDDRVPKWEIIE